MARMTTLQQEREIATFVCKAAEHFARNPQHNTYGDLTEGSYMALRWGLGNDCVLVVKLDENFEPVNYQQAVRGAQEAL